MCLRCACARARKHTFSFGENVIILTLLMLFTSSTRIISSNCAVFILTHTAGCRAIEPYQEVILCIIYTTEWYANLISFFFICFLSFSFSFFYSSHKWSSPWLFIIRASSVMIYVNETKRWKHHLMPSTMETLMHNIWHDYFAHLTGFIQRPSVHVFLVWRILTFRLRDRDCILNLQSC